MANHLAANPKPVWTKTEIFTNLWPSSLLTPEDKKSIQLKVQAVANYCFEHKLFLRGAPADGDCFFHSFLSSCKDQKIAIVQVTRQKNKISILREILADTLIKNNPQRAIEVSKDGIWISSDEGALISGPLKIGLRVITVNEDKSKIGIEDRVYKGEESWEWKAIPQEKRALFAKIPIIIDLGRHFIWASPNSLPVLTTRTFYFSKKGESYEIDGTEENFVKLLRGIAELNSHHLKTKKNPSLDEYDSDEDFAEQQDEGERISKWSGNAAPSTDRTTITCSDRNVKGNTLLSICRRYISFFIKHQQSDLSEEDKRKCAVQFPGKYFALCAGRFAKYKTSLDSQQAFAPGTYVVGLSKVQLQLTEKERLIIDDPELKNWITKGLGLHIERWDLPYRGYGSVIGIKEIIEAIKNTVVSYTAPEPRKVPDNELGTAQLFCAFPTAYPIRNGPYVKLLKQGALHKFFDFFNALIFGVEASRNNSVFLTGLLTLIFMRYGSYPSKSKQEGTFFYDDLIDIFPLAVTGTGAGNFIAEKAMYIASEQLELNINKLAGRRPFGFSTFRENFKWLKVTVKSALIIRNWLEDLDIITGASKEPFETTLKPKEIFDSDDFEAGNQKSEYNDQLLKNFRSRLEEQLEKVLLLHYESESFLKNFPP